MQQILNHPWLDCGSGSGLGLVAKCFEDVQKENKEFFELAKLLDNSRNDQLVHSDDSCEELADDPFGDF